MSRRISVRVASYLVETFQHQRGIPLPQGTCFLRVTHLLHSIPKERLSFCDTLKALIGRFPLLSSFISLSLPLSLSVLFLSAPSLLWVIILSKNLFQPLLHNYFPSLMFFLCCISQNEMLGSIEFSRLLIVYL